MTATYLANDSYTGKLRTTWIASPADTTLAVDAIPANVPTLITVGYGTDYETLFSVTATSGTDSSNYALTGVARVSGANVNIPSNTAVNCLNNAEFFNQYATTAVQIDSVQTLTNKTINDSTINSRINPRTTTETSSATPTINTDNTDIHTITALAADITSMTTNLSGTPVNGQKLIIRIKDDGTARAITWGASFASRGATLPTTTVLGKYHYIGLIYNSTSSVWDCVAAIVEA